MSRRYLAIADAPGTADLVLGVLDAAEARNATCLLLGCDGQTAEEPAGLIGVSRILVAPDTRFDSPPDLLAPGLAEHARKADVLLLDSSQAARDLAGWLSVSLGARVAWAVDRVRVNGAADLHLERVVNGGDARLIQRLDNRTPMVLLTRTTTRLSARDDIPPEHSAEAPHTISLQPATTLVRRLPGAGPASPQAPLAGARIVVAVGRGIGGAENLPVFRELADALGASLGASRVVVDQGWLPFGHQVGQTGTVVAPELYLAFGVSGAVQHLVGMRESRTIVAVNTDRLAPICEMADLVIEGDAVDVARSLLAHLEASRGGQDE